MTLKRRITVFLIAGLVIAGVVAVYYMPQWQTTLAASKGGRRGGPATDPVPVLASAARVADVPVYLDGVGTAKALNTVTVRSQVDGKIINISFKEGQDVPKGYVLAKIDPVTYQAQYDQAVAKKAQDEAQLANARLDLERYTRLVAANAANKQQLDTQKALVSQLEAQTKLDQAQIDNARAILSYTDVVAPIAGRTGIRLVDEGNLVRAADTTGIVILTQLRPISVFFSLPQQNLPDLTKGMAEGALPVDALTPDGKSALDRGKVLVIDNQVDQTTGTVKLKAEFPNTNLQLWPGQFVNVRVLIDTLAPSRGGADRRRPARPQRALRLRRQGRQHGGGAAGDADPAGRRAVGGRHRPAGGRARGHHRLCPLDRGNAGEAIERGGRRAGLAGRPAAPGWNARHARSGEGQAHIGRGRDAGRQSMSVSSPFIQRPIATSLLGIAVMLGGILGYLWLPVSSLPQVDFPTIQVRTQLPGASPDVMAALVTAPLERNFGQIPSLQLMTSSSSFGISQITLQFDLGREIDAAAQDVQAAINASGSVLPRNLPYPPVYSKVNPADAPMVTLAITSDTLSLRALSDVADTLLAQRLSELTGVGRVTVQGNIRPAVRVQADLSRLANYGIALEDLRNVIVAANVAGPKGSLDGAHQSYTIAANDQLAAAEAYRNIIITYRNGAPVLLRDVATIVDGLENSKVAGFYQGAPAIVVDIQRQPGANVIETVQRVKNELPKLQRSMPVGATLTVVHDATASIRASVRDVQFTLILSVALVITVVLIFLRTIRATIIAGVALPLSLIATFGIMWFCGFSLDNLSLMALTIGTGFVVDDAIVMIENIVRHMENGEDPFEAALRGASEIGFTVISLTVSLIAVFIPLLFMTGLVGRMFREFALTLTIAVVTSAVVSLTLTPMMCSRLLRHQSTAGRARRRHPDLSPRGGLVGGGISAEPRMGAAPRNPHPRGHRRHARRDRLALHHHPEGLLAAAGHRPHLRRDGRRTGGLVPGDEAAAGHGRDRHPQRSRRHRRGLRHRRDADQCHAECRPARHHAALARRAQDAGDGGHRTAAAGGRRGSRRRRLLSAGAGHPDLDSAQPRAIPVHAHGHRCERGRRLGGAAGATAALVRGDAGGYLGGAERRLSIASPSRSRDRRPPGRLHADHCRHLERRLRPTPDFDHLRPGQPVPRDPRGPAGIPERSRLAVEALRSRLRRAGGGAVDVVDREFTRRHPDRIGQPDGAVERGRPLRAHHRAAGDRPSGAVPGGHDQLQPRPRGVAQRRGQGHLAGRARDRHADLGDRQLFRRRGRIRQVARRRTLADPGRGGHHLHRARRALRELHSPASRSCPRCRRPGSAPCSR